MCGEKFSRLDFYRLIYGSPPHVRGKVIINGMMTSRSGITPACAGKSREWLEEQIGWEDHPRMCGEK